MKHFSRQLSADTSRAGRISSGLFFARKKTCGGRLSRLIAGLLVGVICLSLAGNAAFATDEAASAEDTPATANVTSIIGGGPSIGASAAIVMEVNSTAILYAKSATTAYEPTSLTKLLTCLIAMENADMEETVDCSYTAINGIGSKVTRVGLVTDERLPLKELIYASLVASADEATYAIGEHVGGTMSNFLGMMSKRVKSLGGVNSNFSNCMGSSDNKIYSCAYDLGLIACRIAQMKDFYTIAGSKWYEIPATNKKESRIIAQTHKFIRKTRNYAYSKAGKSGGESTSGKYSLCTYADKDGMTLVAIILDSETNEGAYDDSETILNWAFENYEVYSVKKAEASANNSYTGLFDSCEMFVQDSMKDLVYTSDNASIVLPVGSSLETVTKETTYYDVDEYFHGENVIGAVVYHSGSAVVGKMEIIFWNDDYPMSQTDFDAVWPAFMIPPNLLVSQGGTGEIPEAAGSVVVTPTPLPFGPSTEDAKTETDAPTETVAPTTSDAGNSSVGSLTPIPTPTPSGDKAQEIKDIEKKKAAQAAADVASHNKKMKVISITIFIVTYLACLTIIYIVLPIQRAKKRRARRNLQR